LWAKRDRRFAYNLYEGEVYMGKRLSVTHENKTGRNTNFHDNLTGENLTRAALVKHIERGDFEKYHVRVIRGIKTPVSNPDKSKDNNLN
jgi:hypothetical protein